MAKIFLSYASDDRKNARRLATFLEDNGHTVWWDRELIIGSDFEQEIDRQLNNADVIIVCWSTRSISSHWVKSEANEGMRGDRLIPVAIEKVPAPRPFDQLTTLDVFNWSDEAGKRLLNAIGDLPDSPSMSVFQKTRQRSRIIASAVATSLALAAVGLWGPLTSFLTPQPANAVVAYEKPRISEAATRHILRRLNDTGRQTSDAAFALIQTGDVHDAIRLLETKYNEMGPDTPKEEEAALLHQIGALAFDYDPAKAHGVYQSLVLLAPDDPLALELSGRLFRDKGNVGEAEKLFLKAMIDNSGLSEVRKLDFQILLDQLKLHKGEIIAAIEVSDELIAKSKKLDAEAQLGQSYRFASASYLIHGDLKRDNSSFVKAEQLIGEAISVHDKSAQTAKVAEDLMTQGLIQTRLNRQQDALKSYEESLLIAKDMDLPIVINLALTNLAYLHIELGEYSVAENFFRQAIQSNTEHSLPRFQSSLWFGLARLSKERGDKQEQVCSYLSKARSVVENDLNDMLSAAANELDCS